MAQTEEEKFAERLAFEKRLARERAAESEAAEEPASVMDRVLDVARAPIKGLTSAGAFMLDMAAANPALRGYDVLTESGDARGVLRGGIESAQENLDEAGLGYAQPEGELTGGERALRTGGEWFGGMFAGPGKWGQLGKLGLKAGAGAAAGEAIGGTPGEIIGGIGAIVTNPKAAGQKLKRAWKKFNAPKAGPERGAVEVIREHATDVPKALKAFDESIARGEQGTLAQRTQDPGLLSMEMILRTNKDTTMAEGLRLSEDAVNKQAREMIETVGAAGDAGAATRLPRARARQTAEEVAEQGRRNVRRAEAGAAKGLAARQGQLTEDLAATQARAESEVGALESAEQTAAREAQVAEQQTFTPDSEITSSQTLRGEVDALEETAKAAERAAWDAVPSTLGVSGSKIRQQVENFIAHGLNKTERASLERGHKETLDYIRNLGDVITPQEAAVIRTKVREAREAAFGKSVSQSDAVALSKIEDKVIRIIEGSHAGEAWQKAVAATRAHREQFGREGLGKAMAKDPALMASETIKPGPRGAEGLEKLERIDRTGPTKLSAAVENDLRVRFKRAMAGSARKAEDFITREYRDTLAKYPRLRDEFTDAVTTRMEAEGLGKATRPAVKEELAASGREMAGLERAAGRDVGEIKAGLSETKARLEKSTAARQKRVEASPAAKFGAYADDPVQAARAVDDVLRGKDPANAAKQLMDGAKTAGPKAVENLKAAFRSSLLKRITSDEGAIKSFASARFKEGANAFKEIFTPQEIAHMDDAFRRAQKIHRDKRILPSSLSREMNPIFDVIISLVGAKIGAASFGSPLIGANIGRTKMGDLFIRKPRKELVQMVTEMSINPTKYREILNAAKEAKTVEEYTKVFSDWSRMYAGLSQTGED